MASTKDLVKGYPLELFLEDIPDKYLCGLCNGCVACDIHIVQCCRKQACLSCLKPYLNDKKSCPYCKEEDFDILQLKKDNEKIHNFRVCCSEKKRGCKWTGLLKELGDHLHKIKEGCKYSPRECPDCQKLVNRHEMANHLSNSCLKREYHCPHCNFQNKFDFVTEAHIPECSYCPVPCPNSECTVTCERNEIEMHIEQICPEQHIHCEYKHAGCDVKYRRKNRDDHMKLYYDTHRIMLETHSLKIMGEWEKLKHDLKEEKKQQREEREAREERIKELEEKNEELEERVERVVKENQEMKAELHTKVDKLAHLLKEQEQNFNQELKQLMRQVNNIDSVQPQAVAVAPCVAQPQAESSPSEVITQKVDTEWELTIDNFTKRKVNQEKWEGPIMTTPRGYNLQVDVWPNGQKEGKGSHLSVWMQYINEKDEEKKKWPAKVTLTLELFNQYPGAEKWQNPIMDTFDILCDQYKHRYNYIGTFGNRLIAHETLAKNPKKKLQFLKEDSINMRIRLLEEQPIQLL